jgi:hypothetical protein
MITDHALLTEPPESFLRASKGSATPIIKLARTPFVGDLRAFKTVYLAYFETVVILEKNIFI